MNIKIKAEKMEATTKLEFSNEGLDNDNYIDLIVLFDDNSETGFTISLDDLDAVVKAFKAIREHNINHDKRYK